MKKIIVLLLVAVIACTAAFAGNLSMGVMQNYLHTNFLVDYEGDHFGAEGAVGLPIVSGAIGVANAIAEGEELEFGDIAGLTLLPAAMVNGYWKPIDTKVFDLRLGLQGDVISFIDPSDKYFSVIGLLGMSIGLDFRFSENFSMNLTGAFPVALPLQAISEEAAQYTLFYYSNNPEHDHWDILLVLPLALNQFGRISFKWTL